MEVKQFSKSYHSLKAEGISFPNSLKVYRVTLRNHTHISWVVSCKWKLKYSYHIWYGCIALSGQTNIRLHHVVFSFDTWKYACIKRTPLVQLYPGTYCMHNHIIRRHKIEPGHSISYKVACATRYSNKISLRIRAV